MNCADCNTEIHFSQLVGKKKKEKRILCLKCADIATGKRDKRGFLK